MRFGESRLPQCFLFVFLVVFCFATTEQALAILVAQDDASQAAYDAPNNWSVGDNGGSGFDPWSVIGNGAGSGSGGGFIANQQGSHPGVSIGTGANNEAFGIFGNSGGVGQAVRPFSSPLTLIQTFSLEMDNQGIDIGGTVGFGLRNASGDNLFEFFFVGGQSTYTVNRNGGSFSTSIGFQTEGLSLSFSLTDADSFSFDIDRLNNGAGVDETVTGDLLVQSDQQIAQLRLFNANGGADVFFNNLVISAVPEPSAFLFVGLICSVLGANYYRKRLTLSQPTPSKD